MRAAILANRGVSGLVPSIRIKSRTSSVKESSNQILNIKKSSKCEDELEQLPYEELISERKILNTLKYKSKSAAKLFMNPYNNMNSNERTTYICKFKKDTKLNDSNSISSDDGSYTYTKREKSSNANTTPKERSYSVSSSTVKPIDISESNSGKFTKFIFEKTKFFQDVSYKDTKYQEFIYEKYRLNTLCQMLLAIISMATAIMGVEVQRLYKNELELSIKERYMTTIIFSFGLCSLCSIFLWALIIIDHYYFYDIEYQEKKISDELLRIQRGPITTLVFFLVLFFLHPTILFLDATYSVYNYKYDVELTYHYNSLFTSFCMLRVIFVFKYYLINSKFYTPHSKRVCAMSKVENSLFFSLKACMQGASFEVYGLLFFLCIAFFTITVRNFELPLDRIANMKYTNFLNVVWGIIITMLTVGYGDLYPSTLEGRALSITSGIIGICMISMLIVSITNMKDFVGNEKTTYQLIERLEMKDNQATFASKLISNYLQLFKALKSNTIVTDKIKENLREKFLVSLLTYEDNKSTIENSYPSISNMEIINNDLEYLEGKINQEVLNYQTIREELDKTLECI